jgi:hypothetical protein
MRSRMATGGPSTSQHSPAANSYLATMAQADKINPGARLVTPQARAAIANFLDRETIRVQRAYANAVRQARYSR